MMIYMIKLCFQEPRLAGWADWLDKKHICHLLRHVQHLPSILKVSFYFVFYISQLVTIVCTNWKLTLVAEFSSDVCLIFTNIIRLLKTWLTLPLTANLKKPLKAKPPPHRNVFSQTSTCKYQVSVANTTLQKYPRLHRPSTTAKHTHLHTHLSSTNINMTIWNKDCSLRCWGNH